MSKMAQLYYYLFNCDYYSSVLSEPKQTFGPEQLALASHRVATPCCAGFQQGTAK